MIGNCRCAAAQTAASEQAAPPISARMASILADGLMEIPPLSNVTPTSSQIRIEKEFNRQATKKD